jgi:hypothetical protein
VFNATSLTLDIDQVAISGAPAFPLPGIPICLTAAVSGPSAGNSFTYSWSVTQNGNPFASGPGSTFTFTPNLNATYLVTLTVSDVTGGTGTATLPIIVAPSIFVLNPSASGALSVSGNASINIPGEVVVDSGSGSALKASGNAQIAATVIDVSGGFQKTGGATFSPAPTTGVSLADPFAGLTGPCVTGLTNYGSVSVSGNAQRTIGPGIYTQISVSGNASLTMKSGTYIIEGGGLTVTGNASLNGSGVFIYNAGSNYPNSSGNFGGITLSGNGTSSLNAPTSGAYAGVLIFQSRQDTRALSFSGNAMAGMTGTIYAANALLSMSGNASLQNPLVVGTLNLSGNVSLTQIAAGSDGSGDVAGIADTLLAGNLTVYINDPSGLFTADELARIQDAINTWDTLLAPCNVTISEVSDPTQANMVIDISSTSACGGVAQGVLGCFNAANGEITMIQGWDWYAGSDPTQIGASQYDFETTVLHELGHALGLGGSTNPNSPMYETLATGVADRTVTTQDLNIPDPPAGADPQMAAGVRLDTPPALPANGFAATGPAANPGLSGLMAPLPAGALASSPAAGLISTQPAWSVQTLAISQAGPAPSLVSQGADQEDGRGLWLTGPRAGAALDSVLEDLAADADRWRGEGGAGTTGAIRLAPDSTDPLSRPTSSGQTAFAHPAVLLRSVPHVEHGRSLARPRTSSIPDAVLEDLAADAAETRSKTAAGRNALAAPPPAGVPNPSAPGDPGAQSQQDRPENRGGVPARLAVALLTVGLWGHGGGIREPRNRRSGRLVHTGKPR